MAYICLQMFIDWQEFVFEIWGTHRGVAENFYVNIFMKMQEKWEGKLHDWSYLEIWGSYSGIKIMVFWDVTLYTLADG